MNPHELAENRLTLSGEYSRASEQLESILEKKPAIWSEIRKNVKSDTSADRTWDGTEMGIHEMKLRMKLKRLEKQMSSISTMLRVFEAEARNQF